MIDNLNPKLKGFNLQFSWFSPNLYSNYWAVLYLVYSPYRCYNRSSLKKRSLKTILLLHQDFFTMKIILKYGYHL